MMNLKSNALIWIVVAAVVVGAYLINRDNSEVASTPSPTVNQPTTSDEQQSSFKDDVVNEATEETIEKATEKARKGKSPQSSGVIKVDPKTPQRKPEKL